jgi:hypothetical protein
MKQTKQILLAFLIPLFLAVGLLVARIYIFYGSNIFDTDAGAVFALYEGYGAPLEAEILGLLIWGMFILSFILPSFVMMRTYQSRKNKLEAASIFE